jgi:hypothetical protein
MYNFISNYLSKENGARKNSPTPMPICQQQTTSRTSHLIACPSTLATRALLQEPGAFSEPFCGQRSVLRRYHASHAVALGTCRPMPMCLVHNSGVLRDMRQDVKKPHLFTVESKQSTMMQRMTEARPREIKRRWMPDLSGENDDQASDDDLRLEMTMLRTKSCIPLADVMMSVRLGCNKW